MPRKYTLQDYAAYRAEQDRPTWTKAYQQIDPAELAALERAAFGDHVCIPLGTHGGHARVAPDASPDVLVALGRMLDAAWEQAERAR